MRRVFLLWLAALLPTLLWSHPEWKEASCIGVIDEKNTFALTVKFDVPSFLVGQLPKDAPIKDLDALMFTPGRLAASIEPGRQLFLAGLRLEADGKPVAWRLESFPTAEQILAQSGRQGEADRYPVLMNAKLTAMVPADTQKLVLRFPDVLGTVFTNLRKGMEFQTVMAVSKNEPGEFQIGDGPAPADRQTFFTLLADGFGHVLPDGWDHCLFMLAMFLGAASLRQALGRSLVFTLGHSITLSAVALGWMGNPGPWIEPFIALTIGLGALMAYRGTATNRQMLVIPAVFGLVHGLGFAAAVSDRLKDWDNGSIVRILVGFNVGVELAQMAVIFTSAALLWVVLRTGLGETKVRRSLCLTVAIVGFGVMAWRVAGIAGRV
ncbi:MAG: HupE/UreJ family protein [Verrucomicrobia bacterium]|nr:HupE/UreJ family protein [Verrucomicrobiota bacterium]